MFELLCWWSVCFYFLCLQIQCWTVRTGLQCPNLFSPIASLLASLTFVLRHLLKQEFQSLYWFQVCVYVRVCVCMHVCMYISACTCMHCVYIYVYACMYMHVHVCACMSECACMSVTNESSIHSLNIPFEFLSFLSMELVPSCIFEDIDDTIFNFLLSYSN